MYSHRFSCDFFEIISLISLVCSTSAPIPDLQRTGVVLWQAFWWDRAWIFEEYSISIASQQNFGNGRMHATFGLHESQVAKHMIAPIASFNWIHRILCLVLGTRSAAESCCIGFLVSRRFLSFCERTCSEGTGKNVCLILLDSKPA